MSKAGVREALGSCRGEVWVRMAARAAPDPTGPTVACTRFHPGSDRPANPNMLSAEVRQLTLCPSSGDKSACLSFLLGFSIYVVIDYFAPNSSDFNLD